MFSNIQQTPGNQTQPNPLLPQRLHLSSNTQKEDEKTEEVVISKLKSEPNPMLPSLPATMQLGASNNYLALSPRIPPKATPDTPSTSDSLPFTWKTGNKPPMQPPKTRKVSGSAIRASEAPHVPQISVPKLVLPNSTSQESKNFAVKDDFSQRLASHPKQPVPALRHATTLNNLFDTTPVSTRRNFPHITPRGFIHNQFASSRNLCRLEKAEAQLYNELIFSTPVLNLELWEKEILNRLEQFVLKRVSEGKPRIKRSIAKFIKEEVFATFTVRARLLEANDAIQESSFLGSFLVINDVESFVTEFNQLNIKREIDSLLTIIGGKKVIECLRSCLDKKRQKAWEEFANKVIMMHQSIPHLESKVLSYPIDFDQKNPISKINREDILDSFRFFYTENEKTDSIFFINDDEFTGPQLKEMTQSERKPVFMGWLIKELNSSLGETDTSNLILQTRLICQGVLEKKEFALLKTKLEELFKKYGTDEKSVSTILTHLPKKECPKHFNHWAKHHLASLFAENSKVTGLEVALKFEELRWFKLSTKHIPCFRILQALSFSAFARVPMIMKNEYSPRLFHSDMVTPRLKSLPTDSTSYRVEIDPTDKAFTVTHRKRYRILTGQTNELVNYGSVNAYWSIRGSRYSKLFSATLRCGQLEISDDHPLDVRLKIVESLDFTDSIDPKSLAIKC